MQARLDLQDEKKRSRNLEAELSSLEEKLSLARRSTHELRAVADAHADALEKALQLTRQELERERARAEDLGPQVAALARRFLVKASQRDLRRR